MIPNITPMEASIIQTIGGFVLIKPEYTKPTNRNAAENPKMKERIPSSGPGFFLSSSDGFLSLWLLILLLFRRWSDGTVNQDRNSLNQVVFQFFGAIIISRHFHDNRSVQEYHRSD